MYKTICMLVGVSAFLVGCAAPVSNYVPSTQDLSSPTVGAISTASVGDEMLMQGKRTEADALVVTGDSRVSWAYTVGTGVFIKRGDDGVAQFFNLAGLDGGRVIKSPLADPPDAIMVRRGNPELCVITVFTAYVCGPAQYVIEKRPIVSANSFQQTLIYSGKIGNKINIGYREFSGNMARPAFNNNVEYDLSESKTIGYKGAELEVLEATNQFIRYRVVRNFNAAR